MEVPINSTNYLIIIIAWQQTEFDIIYGDNVYNIKTYERSFIYGVNNLLLKACNIIFYKSAPPTQK